MGLFFAAGAAGFVTLLAVLGLGRRVESPGGRVLLIVVALAAATAVALAVLALAGGMRLELLQKIGAAPSGG